MRKLVLGLAATLSVGGTASAAPQVVQHISIPDGGWDLLSVDRDAHRLLLAHGDAVTAVDLKDGHVTGQLVPGSRFHDVVPVLGSGLAVATAGGTNTAILFEVGSGKVRSEIKTGAKPDAAIYVPETKMVWVMNPGDGTISIVDPRAAKVTGTIAVGGSLELAALDSKGHVFVNVEDKNELVELSVAQRKVLRRIALPGCDGPTGVAFASGNLISACANGIAKFVRASDGKVVGEAKIGPGPDGAFVDPARHRAYIPSGRDGTLAVFDTTGTLPRLIATVRTQRGARTGTVDLATGRVYLPTARYEAAAAGRRPKLIPGSVEILVVQP